MEITPDRLIDAALDNLKKKLTAVLPRGGIVTPAAYKKLPGAIREAVDELHRKGVRNVRSKDILAEARAELASRLAGSLKAGILIPKELSPEVVKWLAGTPLAVQITNLIRPAGRAQKAGGLMAAALPVAILTKPSFGSGPITIVAKPPGESSAGSGPITIIARPPGDSAAGSGPITIVAQPPGESSAGSGPIAIIARPPRDSSAGGGPITIVARPPGESSAGSGPITIVARPPGEEGADKDGSQPGNPSLGWLLPIVLSAATIGLLILGGPAGSIAGGRGITATATGGPAPEMPRITSTFTPSEVYFAPVANTPTATIFCSPTATRTSTPTSTWTDTPTSTPTPGPFFMVVLQPNQIYYHGTSCGEKQARFQVQVADPAKVAGVWLFVKLVGKEGEGATGWSEALVMTPLGSGWYSYTLFSEEIPQFSDYRDAWVPYQFVAYDKKFDPVASSDFYWDLELSACDIDRP